VVSVGGGGAAFCRQWIYLNLQLLQSLYRHLAISLSLPHPAAMHVQEVDNSKQLRRLLKICLTTFNYLNTGPLAVGFQLETLLNLQSFKSTSVKGITMLHFIAR
jgi:Formin Homology 2 Domain